MKAGICKVDGCNCNIRSRGWCSSHWNRWKRYGSPTGMPIGPRRFLQKLLLLDDSEECITWPYSTNGRGYGRIRRSGKMCRVNRIVCEVKNGPPPTDKHEAAHTCGNRICCNPAHIKWATKSQNERDKVKHGTSNRGERHAKAKLNRSDVLKIRALHKVKSRKSIAKQFNVAVSTISAIQNNENWAWLK